MTALRAGSPPRGLFKGTNFLTPTVLAYYKLGTGWAELSEGRGMSNQLIYGVTVRPETEQDYEAGGRDNRRSRLFQSYREALDYIMEMS